MKDADWKELAEWYRKRAEAIRKERGDDDFYVKRFLSLSEKWNPQIDTGKAKE